MERKVEILGNRDGRLCVLNALDSDRGRTIAEELLGWLAPLYEVHVVWHGMDVYEHEGLAYMRDLVLRREEACLYVHTKGAVNHPLNSPMVREMWRREFGDKERSRMYFDAVYDWNGGAVACPISGPTRITRYNGFVANEDAMEVLDLSFVHERMWYENMWERELLVDVRAMKYWGSLAVTHRLLEIEYNVNE